MPENFFYKKTINFNAWKHSFQFETSQELFSSHDIDIGTRQLLRSLVEAEYPGFKRILDLGCGYGVAGLVLKALYPASEVHLVDRDALAVDFTRRNADLNHLSGEIYPSLGYDDLRRNDFDLIVSNIPGKAGEPVIGYWLEEAARYLSAGGIAAVVVVAPLEPVVNAFLTALPGVEILVKRDWADHSVFHYRFSSPAALREPISALDRGIYNRQNSTFRFEKIEYPADTAFGLPDFDSLGNENDLLFYNLTRWPRKESLAAMVYNPSQGHAAVMLWHLFKPRLIILAGRDLLALRYARHNLLINGCPDPNIRLLHQSSLTPDFPIKLDLAVVSLREEEGPAANLATMQGVSLALSPRAEGIETSGSTAETRLEGNVKKTRLYSVSRRDRWRGQSLRVLTPRR